MVAVSCQITAVGDFPYNIMPLIHETHDLLMNHTHDFSC